MVHFVRQDREKETAGLSPGGLSIPIR